MVRLVVVVVIVVNEEVVVMGKDEMSVQRIQLNEASPASRAGSSDNVGKRLLLLLVILSLSEKTTSRECIVVAHVKCLFSELLAFINQRGGLSTPHVAGLILIHCHHKNSAWKLLCPRNVVPVVYVITVFNSTYVRTGANTYGPYLS